MVAAGKECGTGRPGEAFDERHERHVRHVRDVRDARDERGEQGEPEMQDEQGEAYMETDQDVREVELGDGQTILARVGVVGPGAPDADGFEDVGTADRLRAGATRVNEVIAAVGSAVVAAASAARPDEISATFGIELAAKPGKAVAAVLADGEAKASISVTLTWHPGGDGRPAAGPEPLPSGATPG